MPINVPNTKEGGMVLKGGWCGTEKRVAWYFEEGGVVLKRGWCGTLKRVVWYFEEGVVPINVPTTKGFFLCFWFYKNLLFLSDFFLQSLLDYLKFIVIIMFWVRRGGQLGLIQEMILQYKYDH